VTGKTHILVSPGQGAVNTLATVIDNVQPSNRLEFGAYGDEVSWALRVEAVLGSPQSWSLGARFEYAVEQGGAGFQYLAAAWVSYSPEDLAANCREGIGWEGPGTSGADMDGFGIVASQISVLPVAMQRTVRCTTLRHRVRFRPSFSGGTNPGLLLSLTAQVH